jgi:hypothetical protein
MGAEGHRAALAAHGLDFFLEAELLSLQLAQAETVEGGAAQFFGDCALERLVTDAKFTNTGFDCHDRASMLIGD